MVNNKKDLLVIAGPTAVGKTAISIKLASELKGEIISADSMQIYRKMNIGTAKIQEEEMKGIRHHLIDIVDPDQTFSVAKYQKMVDNLIPQIADRGNLPIIVGGTGLYIKSVVEGFLFPEMEKDPAYRDSLEDLARKEGNDYLHNKLMEVDPHLARKLHPNDLRRIIRGLEVYHQTGKTITYFKKLQEEKPDRYHTLKIGLTRKREDLYSRINQRVDLMIKEGLIEEVKELLQFGYNPSHTAMQGLGYKELAAYLAGNYPLDEAVRILKRDTRHYAKRQLTWFRRDNDYHWFNLTNLEQNKVIDDIINLVAENIP